MRVACARARVRACLLSCDLCVTAPANCVCAPVLLWEGLRSHICEINYSAAISAPGSARSFLHVSAWEPGSPLPDLHGDTAPPCPMLHRAASRAGEPLAGLAVPHLRTELSATSQIRIAALPHLHRDRAFSCRICTLSRSPTVECPFSVLLLHSLPRWMPELPLKLVSHAILLSPYCHTAASGLDSPRHGLRSPRLESGEAAC